MIRIIAICALALFPLAAQAQDTSAQEETDKGFLTTLLEDSLSSSDSTVAIQGFEGALSSEAKMASLTVADADGIWLTLEGIVLSWNRAALLGGAIDVTRLTAKQVVIARAPISEASAPSPEASPFSLPQLPVSIKIDQLGIDKVTLGAPLLGEEVTLTLSGAAALAGGEGSAKIAATRTGNKSGQFNIDGSYSNETRILGLDMSLAEDAGGLAATLLDLPGAPSVGLHVKGTAPIDAYSAELLLSTEGQDRVTGRFSNANDVNGGLISLDLSGDVTPLFAPEYQAFFGDNSQLAAQVRTAESGALFVDDFNLTTDAVTLAGSATIAAEGWPQKFDVRGQISQPNGDAVLLPMSGEKTYVERAELTMGFDASISDDWSMNFDVVGFERPEMIIKSLKLNGGGNLLAANSDTQGQFNGSFTYAATGLDMDDAGLAQALGADISGAFTVSRQENTGTQLSGFTLNGPGIEVAADVTIEGPTERFETRSDIVLKANDLSRFATLIGRPLNGSGTIGINSTIAPFDGAFDALINGTTQDLSVGVPQLDATFLGAGKIAAAAERDTNGTRLTGLTIQTKQATLRANANLTSKGSNAQATFDVADVSLIEPSMSGPINITADVVQNAAGVADATVEAISRALNATVKAQINPAETGQTTNFDAQLNATDLSQLSGVLQRDIAGAATINAQGVVLGDTLRFDMDIAGETDDLALGIETLDPLLRGTGQISGGISRLQADLYRISKLEIKTPALGITADGQGGLQGQAQLAATVDFLDGSIVGRGSATPLSATLLANRGSDEIADIDLKLSGAGTTATLDASVAAPDDGHRITGKLDANINRLSAFAQLIGQPLSGAVKLNAAGSALPDLSAFDITLDAATQNIGIGNAIADKVLNGTGKVRANAQLANGSLSIRDLSANTPQLALDATLDGRDDAGSGQFDLRLSDIGLFTDQLSGPITANGTAALAPSGEWAIDAAATGPGGLTAKARGTYGSSGVMNMAIDSQAPLGLANDLIEPRRLTGQAAFDLSVNGPASLNAIGGRVQLIDARLAAPTLGQALSKIDGDITLSNGQANVNLSANVEAGGSLTVRGPVDLTNDNSADLTIRADAIVLRDPTLYETTISGALSAKGPLANGARISGQLALGTTEIRVPSSGIGALGDLPQITHVGASPAVRRTIARADAGSSTKPDASSNGLTYPLDITVSAPSRIFVRGRGVDAELGGSLRISGTTNAVVPSGLFELVRGRIDILQQRFDLTEGSASLQGDFLPFVRLVASTQTATGTTVRIIVEGPASEPEIRFESTPELPQDEVLAQLIFGRDLTSLSPLQAVQLASAVGTLAGRGGGGLVDTFRQDIGLDDLDITTDDEGNAAVRAGKYISENVYTDVTVSSDGSTDININLDVTDDIKAKGSVGADGETSIGIFFERDY